jgi:3-deoxy-D-manno-octulosonic-acid transferase
MSAADAQRFAVMFGRDRVEVISNLKFDRLDFQTQAAAASNPLNHLFNPEAKILILGSVRQEEENLACKMIQRIRKAEPQTIICIFPRHAHRLHHWSSLLDKHHFPWTLRSCIETFVTPGSIILWDTYGELVHAYGLSQAAFVGGSLVPLGGQNFLEPMACGVLPVIGPHWDNFAWVGKEVISDGLVRLSSDWKQAADRLIDILSKPPNRKIFRQKALAYVRARQGGMASACQLIEQYIDDLQSD